MATIAEALDMAMRYHQAGQLTNAEGLYRQVLEVDPNNADALHYFGVLASQMGRHQIAVDFMQRSVVLKPLEAAFHSNLGLAWQSLGNAVEAAASFRQASQLQPHNAELCHKLGNALGEQGKTAEAEACYRQALALDPRFAAAANNLAIVLERQGKSAEAETCFQTALRIQPDRADVLSNLANTQRAQGKFAEAVNTCHHALRLRPDLADAHINLGAALAEQGKLLDAASSFRQALQLQPSAVIAHNNLGSALYQLNRVDDAETHLRHALGLRPEFADAHVNLAAVLADQGKTEESGAHLQRALQLAPNDHLRIALATLLPVVYQSSAEMNEWRARLVAEVRQLHAGGVTVDLTEQQVQNVFYLAYQGQNDCDIHRELAALYKAPATTPAQSTRTGPRSRKIQVGFLSSYLKDHTVGFWTRGLIAQLCRDDFAVTVLSVGNHDDATATFIRQHADLYVEVPRRLTAARRLIAQQQLDVLLYPDIGMEPFTATLAHSRLAPVQCVLLGHPVTTGIDTMDYFISADALETENPQEYYTESLVRLKHLPVYLYRPELRAPAKKREDFGLTRGDHVYSCLQMLFKFHPDFDQLLGGILRADPQGILLLTRGRVAHAAQLLRQRLTATLPDVVDRIHFLPMLTYQDYLNVLALSDVMLDPIHFGGGGTSSDGLAMGTPIVTMPSQLLRGRITHALYQQMGVFDCVASSPQEYVDMAVRLGADRDYRAELKSKILEANGALFENSAGVRELEDFLKGAAWEKQANTPKPSE